MKHRPILAHPDEDEGDILVVSHTSHHVTTPSLLSRLNKTKKKKQRRGGAPTWTAAAGAIRAAGSERPRRMPHALRTSEGPHRQPGVGEVEAKRRKDAMGSSVSGSRSGGGGGRRLRHGRGRRARAFRRKLEEVIPVTARARNGCTYSDFSHNIQKTQIGHG